MAESRILIRGGSVVTLDPSIGDFGRGDVLVEGETIAAVGPRVEASDAEVVDATDMVVVPGFVDSHRHTWQAALRGVAADWAIDEYFREILGSFGPVYRPEDVFVGNLAGLAEALDAGITTILDWSHIMNSAEHGDAAVGALEQSGLRAVFAYGLPRVVEPEQHAASRADHAARIEQLRGRHFAEEHGRIRLALALPAPERLPARLTADDLALGRQLGLRSNLHVGIGHYARQHAVIEELDQLGALGADVMYVHCNSLSDRALDLIAASGGAVSISPESELQMGHGFPATGRLLARGIRPSLSIDVVTAVAGEMFTQMRLALQVERALAHEKALGQGRSVDHLELSAREVLEVATVQGARALGLADRCGTITPGKQADLVLLRCDRPGTLPVNDPVVTAVLFANVGSVDTVLVAGRILKRRGELVGIGLPRLRQQLVESRDALFARSGRSRAH
ncbi:MAG: amidohydrolase family protein [Chloroflexi bacterium]|nr:amidohydrolase family protein [Chloroflexota bacterium]